MKRWKIIVIVLVCAAVIAGGIVLTMHFIGGSSGASGPLPKPPISAIGKYLAHFDKSNSPLADHIVGDKVVTFNKTNLQGKLPAPALPAQVVTRGNPNLKRVALTLDDGWNADMRILTLLKSKGIKFTTFLIGDRGVADAHPEFVKAIQDSGGEVCSHTLTHYVMRGKDHATVMNEIWQSQENITKVTHEIYPYIRFSGGAYDANALKWTSEQGYWVVNWTLSDDDTTTGATVDRQVNGLLSGLQNGAIILCHWGGYNTYDVLSRAIPEIQKRGYEVTSLSRVLEGTPYVLNAAKNAADSKAAPGTQPAQNQSSATK